VPAPLVPATAPARNAVNCHNLLRVLPTPESLRKDQGCGAAGDPGPDERRERSEQRASPAFDHIPDCGDTADTGGKRGHEHQCVTDIVAVDKSSPGRGRDIRKLLGRDFYAAKLRSYLVTALDETEIGAVEAVRQQSLDRSVELGARMKHRRHLADFHLPEDVSF
jgi:hypothetical protein